MTQCCKKFCKREATHIVEVDARGGLWVNQGGNLCSLVWFDVCCQHIGEIASERADDGFNVHVRAATS
jgi:hypothetical protein